MKQKPKSVASQLRLSIDSEVVRQIRQHGRSSTKAEVCGVLIGHDRAGVVEVEACITGLNAEQAGAHVTFTQDTWEHIYLIKEREYPESLIVGWYHSHPGFGVFLSDHDTFIHKNFFSSAQQVAWVYDPHSDEEGCFGWVGERLQRLAKITLADERGGEGAGETGKPEPLLTDTGEDEFAADSSNKNLPEPPLSEGQALLRTGFTLLTYASTLLIGFFVCWFLFPHFVPVPVDARTGQILYGAPAAVPSEGQNGAASGKGDNPAGQSASPASQPTTPAPPPQGGKGKP